MTSDGAVTATITDEPPVRNADFVDSLSRQIDRKVKVVLGDNKVANDSPSCDSGASNGTSLGASDDPSSGTGDDSLNDDVASDGDNTAASPDWVSSTRGAVYDMLTGGDDYSSPTYQTVVAIIPQRKHIKHGSNLIS